MKVLHRQHLPVALRGAADWSDSPVETVDGLLGLLSREPSIRADLVSRTHIVSPYGGRPLIRGDWSIAYLGFVVSREPAISRWHRRTDESLWHRFGFDRKPTYDTVHHHFARLEDHIDDFRVVASKLIQKAVEESRGLVGRDVHIDGTEAETNARMYHACGPGDNCARKKNDRQQDRNTTNKRKKRKPPPVAKESTAGAHTARQQMAAVEPDFESGDEALRQTEAGRVQTKSGCWYETADPTAGVRVYRRRGKAIRAWLGFNNLKAIDHYTGAVIATDMINAAQNESDAYPQFLNTVIENTNVIPRSVVGDKGLSIESIFKQNTQMGIASVFPWRRHASTESRDEVATAEYDQHGIPRCPDCGVPGVFQSFSAAETPRIWFTCPEGCGRKTISCSKGWRFLLPLWRTSESYQALRKSHTNYEKTHWRWRDQWLVAPDNPTGRIRRRGLKCHALRANAAMLLEWLLVCHREGWLDNGPRVNENEPFTRDAEEELRGFLRYRMSKGLHLAPRPAPRLVARTRAGP